MTMSDEMKRKREQLLAEYLSEQNGGHEDGVLLAAPDYRVGFAACHNLMAAEIKTLENQLKKVFAENPAGIVADQQFEIKTLQAERDTLKNELTAWKEQAGRVAWCVEMITNQNRLRGYPTGPEWQMIIDDITPALTAFTEFKSLQSGNKAPESAQETGECDRTVTKEREG